MKKLILAIMGLACAFAISSCCDQSYCPGNRRCDERFRRIDENKDYRDDGRRYEDSRGARRAGREERRYNDDDQYQDRTRRW